MGKDQEQNQRLQNDISEDTVTYYFSFDVC